MNKKFSTLVASLLLASSVGAYAQNVIEIAVGNTTSAQLMEVPAYHATAHPDGGYVKGQSYFLKDADGNYLKETNGKLVLVTAPTINKLADLTNLLWTLQAINTNAGTVAPTYLFVNQTTGTALSFSADDAVELTDVDTYGSNNLGGEIATWLGAPSYKDPTAGYPFYTTIPGDSVIAMVKKGSTSQVVPAKMKHAELDAALHFKPVTLNPNQPIFFPLSPNELNTMLGKAGETATADNFFQLSFNPAATVKGEDNLWTQDLQAVAVEQYALEYGKKADDAHSVKRGTYAHYTTPNDPSTFTDATDGAAIWASLNPLREKDGSTSKYSDLVASNEIGFKSTEPQWVALRNADGQYLVADTLTIGGTVQQDNNKMSFKFVNGLYDARGNDRYRHPGSYLWKITYNPMSGEVRIQSQTSVQKKAPKITDATANENPKFYQDHYVNQPKKLASEWYADDASNNTVSDAYVVRAALGATSEVTLVNESGSYPDAKEDKFTIKLGNAGAYVPGYVKSGAYLLKVTGSKDEKKIGKYWVANLKGNFEIMEEAVRQNFQDMPSAQWIVKSAGTGMGSPITIANREFNAATESSLKNQSVTYAGMVYVGGANNEFFFMNGDTLQFIPVENPADKYLGYKYVANDTIAESTFTFNYLHDLAMNKPINTTNDKDSVVWVDRNGAATNFILERVLDDTYGTNGDLKGVATLVRSVYNIKVNDATKLQNDKRYLAYDAQLKKYVVSTDKKDKFFLKEYNEDGACYYAIIPANVEDLIVYENGQFDHIVNKATMVIDADATNLMFVATDGDVVNQLTGVAEEGKVIMTFDKKEDAQAYINGRSGLTVYKVGNTNDITTNEVCQLYNGSFNLNDLQVKVGKYVIKVGAAFNAKSVSSANYASKKVSVDNNTLNLVNGVLNDNSANEVATSAFAVTRDADPLYRRFNTELEGEANDAPKTLKFYRVNGAAPEYLFEDANSKYSAELGVNFLGVEGKGDAKNAAMYVDTAYVRNNTRMPQYMLVMNPTFVEADTVLCDASTHSHATKEEALACEHSKVTKGYVEGRYLINLLDSVEVEATRPEYANKYQWNYRYTRLAFVQARHIDDTLVIANSVYTNDLRPIKVGQAATIASKDSIFLGNNLHKNVVFSFRYVKSDNKDFLIESETSKMVNGNEVYAKNTGLEAVKIAPNKGGWIKIQNGVPVIANVTYNEAALEAEIFNVEKTDEDPTANEAVEAAEVSVVAAQGAIIVKGAAGKVVTVSNVLGQTIANQVAASDNVTIAAPAGIAVVTVDGETVKVVVK
ncbi:hypothetical protein JQM83_00015 [Parabacteroides distasonis]|nr:hypothetical protein [Parabacteroides distasonis]